MSIISQIKIQLLLRCKEFRKFVMHTILNMQIKTVLNNSIMWKLWQI